MKKDGKLFVLHENYVCDVTEFINFHPGGIIHLEESIGLDVSRYVTGTDSINNNFVPHDHSLKAREHLMTLVIAELVEEHGLVLKDNKRYTLHKVNINII